MFFQRMLEKHKTTKDIKVENYRFYAVIDYISWIGFLGHLTFLLAFHLTQVKHLALLNIVSCAVYMISFLVNRKGLHNTAFYLGTSEVVMHAVLACICLGWKSGFHYYILCLIPLVFFSSTITRVVKILLTIAYCTVYLYLQKLTLNLSPTYPIDNSTLMFFSYMNMIMTAIVLALLAYYFSQASLKTEKELMQLNERLDILAQTDPLTTLMNRRSMMNRISVEIQRSSITYQPFALILADIDDFKQINDRLGHDYGDYILKEVSYLLYRSLRSGDLVARWGGEEFLILLPGMSAEEGKNLIDRLRDNIQNHLFSYEACSEQITMTFGIGIYEQGTQMEDLIKRADDALYQGKRTGKNCVVLSSSLLATNFKS